MTKTGSPDENGNWNLGILVEKSKTETEINPFTTDPIKALHFAVLV